LKWCKNWHPSFVSLPDSHAPVWEPKALKL